MRPLKQEHKLEALDALRPHPDNPRQGDVGAIHQSIEHNGFYGTIIAQRSTGYILAGNHRWQAAKAAGLEQVPVTWLDVNDEHALRILLADNRTNDLATYDDDALAQLLQTIHAETGTLDGTGYDGDDLGDLLQDLTVPDSPPQAEPELKSEALIEIRCTNEQLDQISDTLAEWSANGLTIDIS